MSISNKQFDPAESLSQSFEALDIAMTEARTILDRMAWAKDKLVTEVEQLREERNHLEIYDEAEAATILTISVEVLRDLRRRLDLPHVNFGKKISYTKHHLNEIISTLEIRKQKSAFKKAA